MDFMGGIRAGARVKGISPPRQAAAVSRWCLYLSLGYIEWAGRKEEGSWVKMIYSERGGDE